MAEFIPEFTGEDFTSDLQREFYDYWLEIRGGRLMPSRADFNPGRIPLVLSSVIMVNVHQDPLSFKIRLMGTECVNAAGLELTGCWIDSIANTEKIIKRYQWLVKNKQPYFSTDNLEWAHKKFKNFTSIVCPFSKDGETVDLLISSNIYK